MEQKLRMDGNRMRPMAAWRYAGATMTAGRPSVNVGDRVSLRKAHPCGANTWIVKRVGMDVKLECGGCGRQVMLARSEFERRYRSHIERADDAGGEK